MKQWGRTIDEYIGVPQHEIWPYPNGKVWGLPFQGGTGDWLYNKSVLDRHGIEPNENWTHDDLIETAKQVQDPENGLWGFTTPSWGTALHHDVQHWWGEGDRQRREVSLRHAGGASSDPVLGRHHPQAPGGAATPGHPDGGWEEQGLEPVERELRVLDGLSERGGSEAYE